MKIFLFSLLILLSTEVISDKQKVEKQAQLDQACEAAREEKLAPERKQFIDECAAKKEKDRVSCERFYSDYGSRSGNRAPLHYDLPECVEAFEFRKSYRKKN